MNTPSHIEKLPEETYQIDKMGEFLPRAKIENKTLLRNNKTFNKEDLDTEAEQIGIILNHSPDNRYIQIRYKNKDNLLKTAILHLDENNNISTISQDEKYTENLENLGGLDNNGKFILNESIDWSTLSRNCTLPQKYKEYKANKYWPWAILYNVDTNKKTLIIKNNRGTENIFDISNLFAKYPSQDKLDLANITIDPTGEYCIMSSPEHNSSVYYGRIIESDNIISDPKEISYPNHTILSKPYISEAGSLSISCIYSKQHATADNIKFMICNGEEKTIHTLSSEQKKILNNFIEIGKSNINNLQIDYKEGTKKIYLTIPSVWCLSFTPSEEVTIPTTAGQIDTMTIEIDILRNIKKESQEQTEKARLKEKNLEEQKATLEQEKKALELRLQTTEEENKELWEKLKTLKDKYNRIVSDIKKFMENPTKYFTTGVFSKQIEKNPKKELPDSLKNPPPTEI